jgi:hypothetical protein
LDHGSGRTASRERIARVLIGSAEPKRGFRDRHAASQGWVPELKAERLADEIAAGGKRWR